MMNIASKLIVSFIDKLLEMTLKMMFLLRIELIKWHFLWDTDKEQLY